MAAPDSRQRAKKLVQSIAKDHGQLEEEHWQTMSASTRRAVEEAFMKKDEMIGSSVITLAKNLYSSQARFVFELLQNADDNSFASAKAQGDSPYISFHVFPHRIVVECNEDGFTYENLKAICAVGQSSKSGSEGYIGEKGIGFKSVFIPAWKAHIQSGVFSFSFSHRDGQSGMGMISPVWEDAFEDLESPLTRLTLHLHDNENTGAQQNAHRNIHEQFHELEETFLLFTKNLKTISVAFHDTDEVQTSSIRYSIERPGPNRATLRRDVTDDGTQQHLRHYHVTTYQAQNIPRHEKRIYSDSSLSTSQVVLAFPLSTTSVPIIQPQDVFVYLPVRPAGFKFLIQADFVTDASRQDIVRDSRRNIALLDGVADAFARAVLQFCEHDSLRLQWMRYLPDKSDPNWGPLWLSLVNKIDLRLRAIPVLYCQKKDDQHLIKDLVRLTDDAKCENGEPLFEGGDPEDIVSQRYSKSDLDILTTYGFEYANFGHTLKWLARDLELGTQSRMKSAATKDSWHTRTAKLLQLPFSKDWADSKADLKAMRLLPLRGGTWVSIQIGPVYFAKVAGINIPPDVGLRFIDDKITNAHRITLFRYLGVQEAPISLIRRKILEMYLDGQPGLPPDFSVQTSKQHLTFLYLTGHLPVGSLDEPRHTNIVLFDEDEILRNPSKSPMYMAIDRKPYSPWELLREGSSLPGYDAPGFMSHSFMHEAYFLDPPTTPENEKLTWVQWFHALIEIKVWVYFGDQSISDAAQYLQEYRPERFLGALRIHHQRNPDLSPELVEEIQDTEVLCRGGQKAQLKNTYFPTKRLEDLVQRFVEDDTSFPWIWLEGEASYDAVPEDWATLFHEVDVGIPPNDLEFALAMLRHIICATPSALTLEGTTMLFDLYRYIQAQYGAEGRSVDAKKRIQEVFTENDAICIPLSESNYWVSPEDCVWKAIHPLQTKRALQIHYESLQYMDEGDKRDLEQLFSNTLDIRDCTLEIYVDELKEIKRRCTEDSDIIHAVYKEMYRIFQLSITHEMSKNRLRTQFKEHALIYVPSDDAASWREISQCVWSTAAQLRGKVSLNGEYEDLKRFFVDIIGVKSVTLSMALDELKEAGNRQPVSVEEVKASVLTVNSLLCSDSHSPQPQPELMESKIFPVRHPGGEVQCASVRTDFFVADREPLRLLFEGRVKFFDFSLEEVVQLHPFLSWAGLDARYISKCVRESTSVQNSGTQPISHPDRQFRHRAHALLRIAKHFKSPRVTTKRDTDALYELLQNAKTVAANKVSLEFSLAQDGRSHRALGDAINVHLHEEGPHLTTYLPRRKIPQQDAFCKHLPERLLQWLMTETDSQIGHHVSNEAVLAMKDVWITHPATLAKTLDDHGIIPIETPNIDPVVEENSYDSDSDSGSKSSTDDWVASQSATHVEDGNHDNNSEVVDTRPPARGTSTLLNDTEGTPEAGDDNLNEPSLPQTARGEPRSIDLPQRLAARDDSEYLSVLEDVIASAASSSIPNFHEGRGQTQRNTRSSAWRGALRFTGRGADNSDRDSKIGAAGELFVFELLCRLHPALPNFSRANWQSNIRHHVTLHPSYARMSSWTGRETSDIIYDDTHGVLTNLLIGKGYLDDERWAGKFPQYFIEVKTTVSNCDAPFFMSNAQYERMKAATLTAENASVIYVIFRVYELDQGNQGPGLRIYVDPESLRLSGQLNFTAQTWSVVPG